MRFNLNKKTLLGSLALLPALRFSSARALEPRATTLATWIASEETVALSSILRNLGGGEFALDADAGCVIASPSTSGPDYFYQWTRDAAITFKVLVNNYINGDTTLETTIKDYVTEAYKLQHTTNPSGSFSTGGIGEPKFNVDGTAYTGSWGRPQTDGPAIRATALIHFANQLITDGDTTYVTENLYSTSTSVDTVIKADLDYIVDYYTTSGYDLWEEQSGFHFFTYMVQHRALIEGAALATTLGDTSSATTYTSTAAAIKTLLLDEFWSSSDGYLITTIGSSRSGLDCGTLLGSLHGNGAKGYGVFTPGSDEVLATLLALVDSFDDLYAINTASGAPGIAIGRYPEDVYDGDGTGEGNPWFICTLTTAEVLYNAVSEFSTAGSITVSSTSEAFFQKFLSTATSGSTYDSGSTDYTTIVDGISTYADTFVATAQLHAATNGSLSEEFLRSDGVMTGARDLTWSYASLLTTAYARAGSIAF
ncbi:glycoside hydrolase 15 protein [Rhizina undulata]